MTADVNPNYQPASPLAGALVSAERGVPQTPLRPGTKSAFKHDWQQSATTDAAQINTWASETAGCNWGSVAKAQLGGIWIFDIDDAGAIQQRLVGIGHKIGELKSYQVRSSPKKGHSYFRHNAKSIALSAEAGDKAYISIKADGKEISSARLNNSYVVSAASIHPDTGMPYQIVNPDQIIEAPDWLIEWIAGQNKTEEKLPVTASSEGPRVPRGSHDNELTRIAGALRAKGLTEEEMLPVLIRNVEERFDDYGSDYVQMCEKVAHSIGKKPAGTSSIPLTSDGKTEAEITQQGAQSAAQQPKIFDLPALTTDKAPEFPQMSGILWDLASAMYPDIPMPFKFMALVAFWGLIRSAVDVLASERNHQPRLYVCLVSDTPWVGKTAAMNESERCFQTLLPPTMTVVKSVDSAPALCDDFEDLRKDHPLAERLQMLIKADEMTDLFEKAKTTAQSRNPIALSLPNTRRETGRSSCAPTVMSVLAGEKSRPSPPTSKW